MIAEKGIRGVDAPGKERASDWLGAPVAEDVDARIGMAPEVVTEPCAPCLIDLHDPVKAARPRRFFDTSGTSTARWCAIPNFIRTGRNGSASTATCALNFEGNVKPHALGQWHGGPNRC